MAKTALILGESGAGKSYSMQFLDPKTTFIINVLAKDLPWKGSGKDYVLKKNLANTAKAGEIIRILKYVDQKQPHIKDIVIDDHTHIYSGYFLDQAAKEEEQIEAGEHPNIYKKFTHIAQYTKNISNVAKNLREDLKVYILHHVDIVEEDVVAGTTTIKAASFGKFVEEKLKGISSLFTVVLVAGKRYVEKKEKKDGEKRQIEGFFKTRDILTSPAKSPQGMFDDDEIPNNLQIVKDAMDCFYNDDCK